MITYGAGSGMPFFLADRKILYPRDYLAGAAKRWIRQEAHKASVAIKSCAVGHPVELHEEIAPAHRVRFS